MTRNYSKVPDGKRQQLIEMINMGMTIKDAAKSIDIKYENAKAIFRVYRKEQRTDKRRNRLRFKGQLQPGSSRGAPSGSYDNQETTSKNNNTSSYMKVANKKSALRGKQAVKSKGRSSKFQHGDSLEDVEEDQDNDVSMNQEDDEDASDSCQLEESSNVNVNPMTTMQEKHRKPSSAARISKKDVEQIKIRPEDDNFESMQTQQQKYGEEKNKISSKHDHRLTPKLNKIEHHNQNVERQPQEDSITKKDQKQQNRHVNRTDQQIKGQEQNQVQYQSDPINKQMQHHKEETPARSQRQRSVVPASQTEKATILAKQNNQNGAAKIEQNLPPTNSNAASNNQGDSQNLQPHFKNTANSVAYQLENGVAHQSQINNAQQQYQMLVRQAVMQKSPQKNAQQVVDMKNGQSSQQDAKQAVDQSHVLQQHAATIQRQNNSGIIMPIQQIAKLSQEMIDFRQQLDNSKNNNQVQAIYNPQQSQFGSAAEFVAKKMPSRRQSSSKQLPQLSDQKVLSSLQEFQNRNFSSSGMQLVKSQSVNPDTIEEEKLPSIYQVGSKTMQQIQNNQIVTSKVPSPPTIVNLHQNQALFHQGNHHAMAQQLQQQQQQHTSGVILFGGQQTRSISELFKGPDAVQNYNIFASNQSQQLNQGQQTTIQNHQAQQQQTMVPIQQLSHFNNVNTPSKHQNSGQIINIAHQMQQPSLSNSFVYQNNQLPTAALNSNNQHQYILTQMRKQESGGSLLSGNILHLAHQLGQEDVNGIVTASGAPLVDNIKPPDSKRLSLLQNNINFVYDGTNDGNATVAAPFNESTPVKNQFKNSNIMTGLLQYIDVPQTMQKLSQCFPAVSYENTAAKHGVANSFSVACPSSMLAAQSNYTSVAVASQQQKDQLLSQQSSSSQNDQLRGQITKINEKQDQDKSNQVTDQPVLAEKLPAKNTFRLPYTGYQQASQHSEQNYPRHVQKSSASSQPSKAVTIDKITAEINQLVSQVAKNEDQIQGVAIKGKESSSNSQGINNESQNKRQANLQDITLGRAKLASENENQLYSEENQKQRIKDYPRIPQIYPLQGNADNLPKLNTNQAQDSKQQHNIVDDDAANGAEDGHRNSNQLNWVNQVKTGTKNQSDNFTLQQIQNSRGHPKSQHQQQGEDELVSLRSQAKQAQKTKYVSDQQQLSRGDLKLKNEGNTSQFHQIKHNSDDKNNNDMEGRLAQIQSHQSIQKNDLNLEVDLKVKDQESNASDSDSSYSAASDEHQVSDQRKKLLQQQQQQQIKQEAADLIQKQDASNNDQKVYLQINNTERQIYQQKQKNSGTTPRQMMNVSNDEQMIHSSQNRVTSKSVTLQNIQQLNDSQLIETQRQHSRYEIQPEQLNQQFAAAQNHIMVQQKAPQIPAQPQQSIQQTTQQLIQEQYPQLMHSSHINQRVSGINNTNNNNEVTRYLINQLEQMHIKLKTLGYCTDDIWALQSQIQQQVNGGQTKSQLEQAFVTIDTFSNDVLSMNNYLSQVALSGQQQVYVKDVMEHNNKMLQSLTSVVKLMWTQLKDSKTRDEEKNQQMQRIEMMQAQHQEQAAHANSQNILQQQHLLASNDQRQLSQEIQATIQYQLAQQNQVPATTQAIQAQANNNLRIISSLPPQYQQPQQQQQQYASGGLLMNLQQLQNQQQQHRQAPQGNIQ